MLINLYLYNPPLAVWLHPTAELMPAFVRLWHPEPLIPLHNGLYFCVSLITNYLEHSPRICPKWEIDAEDLFFREVFFRSLLQLVLPLQLSLFLTESQLVCFHTCFLLFRLSSQIFFLKKRFVTSSHAKSKDQPFCTRMQICFPAVWLWQHHGTAPGMTWSHGGLRGSKK